MSMSGYERSQDSCVYGYSLSRPGQGQSYTVPAQSPFEVQYPTTQADESHALVSTLQTPYLGQAFEPRDTAYQTDSASLIDARTRSSPEITSRGPSTGRAHETFKLHFRSKVDFSSASLAIFILFGSTPAAARLNKEFYRDPYHYYSLHATIPPPGADAQASPTMPLLLDVQNSSGHSINMKALENFTYLDSIPYTPHFSGPLQMRKKRKYDDGVPTYSQTSAKRVESSPLQLRDPGAYSSIVDSTAYNLDSGAGLYALPTNYDRPASQHRSYAPSISDNQNYHYPESSPAQHLVKARSPSLGGFANYSSMPRPSPSPRMSAPRIARSNVQRASSTSSNPPLVRTSILQPQTSSQYRSPGFNPYAIYPSAKAKLEIRGDLLSMAALNNWSEEEVKVKRRLIEFHRRQEDSIIYATPLPVAPEKRTQGTHCISCIYWEERGESFVTSVDTIQLLEGLVGVRFTVEEKNRIRRNLEGFKPLTVSKQREDTESFFRLIMGFPNPKPRNIEKDVKVFPWSILASALKKIIGKYSASYASTSAILTPSPSAAFVSTVSESGMEHHPTASPPSTTSSAASHGYPISMTSTALSAGMMGRSSMDITAGPYDHLRHQAPPQSVPGMSHWSSPYTTTISGSPLYSTGHGYGGPSQMTSNAHSVPSFYGASAATDRMQHPDDQYPTSHH